MQHAKQSRSVKRLRKEWNEMDEELCEFCFQELCECFDPSFERKVGWEENDQL